MHKIREEFAPDLYRAVARFRHYRPLAASSCRRHVPRAAQCPSGAERIGKRLRERMDEIAGAARTQILHMMAGSGGNGRRPRSPDLRPRRPGHSGASHHAQSGRPRGEAGEARSVKAMVCATPRARAHRDMAVDQAGFAPLRAAPGRPDDLVRARTQTCPRSNENARRDRIGADIAALRRALPGRPRDQDSLARPFT